MDIEPYKICVEAIEEIDENIETLEGVVDGCGGDIDDNPYFSGLNSGRRKNVAEFIIKELGKERKKWEDTLKNIS